MFHLPRRLMPDIPLDTSLDPVDQRRQQYGYAGLIEIIHHAHRKDLLPGEILAERNEKYDIAVHQLRYQRRACRPQPEMLMTSPLLDPVKHPHVHDLTDKEGNDTADNDPV